MTQLTARQREIYDFIVSSIRTKNYAPSVREMCDEFGISSPQGIVCHLKALEKKRLITREPGKSRAITLINGEAEAVEPNCFASRGDSDRVLLMDNDTTRGASKLGELRLDRFAELFGFEVGPGECVPLHISAIRIQG